MLIARLQLLYRICGFQYKMLSYRRETALEGRLVMAQNGRLELREYFTDIIDLSSSTVT